MCNIISFSSEEEFSRNLCIPLYVPMVFRHIHMVMFSKKSVFHMFEKGVNKRKEWGLPSYLVKIVTIKEVILVYWS